MLLATAAPAMAASQAVCVQTVLQVTGDAASPQTVYTADGYSVRIASSLKSNTTTTQNGTSYNLNRNGGGWNGGTANDGSKDFEYFKVGPPGAVVLNQRTKDVNGVPIDTAPDSQTVTFDFFDPNNLPVNPISVEMTIFDITSAQAPDGQLWRGTYWDTVGFSETPTSIKPSLGLAPGKGSGSKDDPFARSTGNEFTDKNMSNSDTFRFNAFPSGSKMEYSQLEERQGWHFIAISGIKFTVPGPCVPPHQ